MGEAVLKPTLFREATVSWMFSPELVSNLDKAFKLKAASELFSLNMLSRNKHSLLTSAVLLYFVYVSNALHNTFILCIRGKTSACFFALCFTFPFHSCNM